MALTEIKFAPGIDKQDTSVGAFGRWVDSDNTRFRYGLPEKVGGWQSLLTDTITGVSRKMIPFVDKTGNRYVGIGTDKFLLIYFEGQLHDITPLRTDAAGSPVALSSTIATTINSPICTLTVSTNHSLTVGDIILLDAVTLPGGTGFVDADFEDKLFQVTSVPSLTTATITQTSNATATVSTGGSITIYPYDVVGPAEQTYGYGFGVGPYGGNTGWGEAVLASDVTLEPGLWSLDTFGDVLVATIANGKTFTWDASIAARLTTRASQLTSGYQTTLNPVSSRATLISPTTRHLIHLGTTTDVADETTQDDMFIRFSSAEAINEYTVKAVNSAGTFRLQDGTRIVGALNAKETILIWTDNSLYTMKFVGAPFTFGFEQVGTNCGLIGKNAAVEIDGKAFWMSNNGFFMFDGTVKALPCSVEDYVYDDIDTTKGQQISAGLNNLYTEVTWWYPTQGSTFNNRSVVYNYGEVKADALGTWYTNTSEDSIRTSWIDTLIYPRPYATKYNSSNVGTFPVVIGEDGLGQTVLFEQETGTDQINPDGTTTALTSFVQSFNFSLQKDQSEVFLAMRRFLPNFKVLTGSNQVTIGVSNWPSEAASQSTYSPFTILPDTQYKSTRARGRYANIKIENINVGENWRFGTFQVDIQPDGRR
mgnify:FL=1|jgi:hypothetical protein